MTRPQLLHAPLTRTIVAAVLLTVPSPNWICVPGNDAAGGTGTTHGSPNACDQHVPLVFPGSAFAPGRYQVAASPADAAPTVAATVGPAANGVEGHSPHASRRQILRAK